jgi:hypothetical protein
MQSIKLLFFLAVWKRPEITEICFMGLQRLKKLGTFHVEHFAVISEVEMIPLCEKYGVEWCMHDNEPLGAKKNYGLRQAMKKEFDYLVEFLNVYPFDRDVMALSDFVMLNTEDGECRRLTKSHGYYGLGRAISKRCLTELFEKGSVGIWDNRLERGLDNYSSFYLSKRGYLEKRYKSLEPVAIDLKSDVNIWPFKKNGSEYPIEKVLEGLSDEEITAIKRLCSSKEELVSSTEE